MSSVITMISGNDALIYLWLYIERFMLLLLLWSVCFVMMAIEAANDTAQLFLLCGNPNMLIFTNKTYNAYYELWIS